MKILVADDDATLRDELAGLLSEDGHEVVTAAPGWKSSTGCASFGPRPRW